MLVRLIKVVNIWVRSQQRKMCLCRTRRSMLKIGSSSRWTVSDASVTRISGQVQRTSYTILIISNRSGMKGSIIGRVRVETQLSSQWHRRSWWRRWDTRSQACLVATRRPLQDLTQLSSELRPTQWSHLPATIKATKDPEPSSSTTLPLTTRMLTTTIRILSHRHLTRSSEMAP